MWMTVERISIHVHRPTYERFKRFHETVWDGETVPMRFTIRRLLDEFEEAR
jgi:hypothetical protein